MNGVHKGKWVWSGILGTTLVVSTFACGEGVADLYYPDAGEAVDAGSTPDASDAGTDGGGEEDADAAPSCEIPCEGDCVDYKPLEGDGTPVLLFLGKDEQAVPPCPAAAPVEELSGYAGLAVAESTCPSCTCGTSSGACALSSSIVAHASTCNGAAGAPSMSTNAPDGWDGACATDNPIPAGLLCNGKPCVQSITLGSVDVVEESCAPEPGPTPSFPAPTWAQFGRACGYQTSGCAGGQVCISQAPTGYQQCLAWRGEHDCPSSEYTARILLYDGFSDTRACDACSCGPPAGSFCSSSVTLYKDSVCSEDILKTGVSSLDSPCADITPPGVAIGSKSATKPVYYPGTCSATGGELLGAVEPNGATTFCCLDLADPH